VDGTTLSIIAGGGQSNASTVQSQPGWQADPDDTEDESSTDDSVKPKGVNAGVAYSQDSGTVAVDAADEGLQGAFVTVSGGTLTIASGDDGINATNGDYTIEGYENADSESDDGAYLTITGGSVQIDYANSDGIDSNGSASVTGGQVVVAGSAGSMDGAVDVNGESDVVGVTGLPSVAVGDTITVTSSDGTSWTLTSTISSDYVTVLGLTEGTEYTVATTSGGSATGTASALSAAWEARSSRDKAVRAARADLHRPLITRRTACASSDHLIRVNPVVGRGVGGRSPPRWSTAPAVVGRARASGPAQPDRRRRRQDATASRRAFLRQRPARQQHLARRQLSVLVKGRPALDLATREGQDVLVAPQPAQRLAIGRTPQLVAQLQSSPVQRQGRARVPLLGVDGVAPPPRRLRQGALPPPRRARSGRRGRGVPGTAWTEAGARAPA